MYCQILDSAGASVGSEFDITEGKYTATNPGCPKIAGFKDGSYGVLWVRWYAGTGKAQNNISVSFNLLNFVFFFFIMKISRPPDSLICQFCMGLILVLRQLKLAELHQTQ